MATDAGAELRVDVHNIEPIPEADKDSTGLQQDPRCQELMARFVRAHPSLWAEDIGT